MKNKYFLSPLGKTWIFDLDGTILKHNGYKIDGKDSFLDGALEFLIQIPIDDMIIILTARTNDISEETIAFLTSNNVRYDHIIFNAPHGERVLINDSKPSGLPTAVSINTQRDEFLNCEFIIDPKL